MRVRSSVVRVSLVSPLSRRDRTTHAAAVASLRRAVTLPTANIVVSAFAAPG
jgi:hypothetical protein